MNSLLPILQLPSTEENSTSLAPVSSGLQLDRRTYDRALACVHCGLCLPACPTYLETGHEAESPRGRIQLMRAISDGEIDPTRKVREHLDSCLDCRACETACPSGVVYHELIEETRDRLVQHDKENRPVFESYEPILRWFTQNVLAHPTRLKMSIVPLRVMQRTGAYKFLKKMRVLELLPPALRKMEQMLPEQGPIWPKDLPQVTGAAGMDAVMIALHNTARGRAGEAETLHKTVGFFAGCVGSVVYDKVNRQAIDLLAACGVDVYAPRQQGCCGAIHQHSGAIEQAREMARNNIDLFMPAEGKSCDYIVTNIAGCGSTLHEYDTLLRDDPTYGPLAREFRKRYRDINQMLCELPLPAMKFPVNLTAAYHDACHLGHAQKVTQAPRDLLARIPGLKLVPLMESDLCCGAAGTYNLTHGKMAGDLANRKLRNFVATGATVLVASNAGCTTHLVAQAKSEGIELKVMHPVELVHLAVFGDKV